MMRNNSEKITLHKLCIDSKVGCNGFTPEHIKINVTKF